MRISRFTKPGEVVFNLIALTLLTSGVLFIALLGATPELGLEWWFWCLLAGPFSFWTAAITILVRLRRSGYRPRFDFRRGLSITGSRECYDAYRARFGSGLLLVMGVAPLWAVIGLFLMALLM